MAAHTVTVESGTHLVQIARDALIADPMRIWAHPDNAGLRARRRDPGVLGIGDSITVPPTTVEASLATGQHHRIVIKLPKLWLQLRLRGAGGAPLRRVPATVEAGQTSRSLTTDDDGALELTIPPSTRRVTVQLPDRTVDLDVAALRPVDTIDGYYARLENLGYAPGERSPGQPADLYALRSAVEEFQCDHGLVVDGIIGDQTRDALLQAHGS